MAAMQDSEFRPWRCGDPWKFPVPNPKWNKHWEECHDLVQKYDEDMFKVWKGEVDNLLIFAGLFSATVTSFTIESYQWLQQQPDDQAIQILAHISMQLKGMDNSSVVPSYTANQFSVSASDIRINVLWFLSLTLSMATVLIGILCMQWLREFGRDAARSHKDAIAIRQMRYEGLYKWKVPVILSLLPLLLQLALVLFFAGILELLWSLDKTVAIWITVAVGWVLLVLVLTTVLPALQSHFTKDPFLKVGQCPYKSPQSWGFYRLTIHIARVYKFALTCIAKIFLCLRKQAHVIDVEEDLQETTSGVGLSHFNRMVSEDSDRNWCDYDVRWRLMRDATFLDPDTGEPSGYQDGDDIVHGLKWIDQRFCEDIETVYYVFYCLLDLNSAQAAQLVGELDPEVDYLPQLLFPSDSRPSLYADSPLSDVQIREHIYMVFFWLHRHIHPSLHEPYLECLIRLMNSNSQCVPRLALRQCDDDLQGVSRVPSDIRVFFDLPETVYQLFNSLKLVVSNDAISKEQGSDIWAFHRDIYSSHPGLHDPIMQLTFDVFDQFRIWLHPSGGLKPREEYRHRVETCAVGLTRVFALTDVQASIKTLRQLESFGSLASLVSDLNTAIPSLLDQSAILRGLNKRRWPDLIAKICAKEEPSLPRSCPRPYPDVDSAVALRLKEDDDDDEATVPGYSAHEIVRTSKPRVCHGSQVATIGNELKV